MFGYAHFLALLTHGRARFATRLDHYAPVPGNWSGGDDDPRFPGAMGARVA
jgi:translation elongation factor EF-G